jgi:hypothetical protein
MNKTLIATIVTGLALIGAAQTAMAGTASPGVNQREGNQAHRIYRGIRQHDLTFREAGKLLKGQAHIRRMERRFKSDGNLSFGERWRLHKALNRQSHRIYRFKHN